MPYRRLPNTDKARLRALNSALEYGRTISPRDLAFDAGQLHKVQLFLQKFTQAVKQYDEDYNRQTEYGKNYSELMRKSRLYVSHFIQVLNMAILREEFPEDIRKYYGLEQIGKRLPALNTEQELLYWGEKVIKGEAKRTALGRNPIFNPRISHVKMHFEHFQKAHQSYKLLQEKSQQSQNQLNLLRPDADDLILNLWNAVEEHFVHLDDADRREKSGQYGVVYVFRKNEKHTTS